MPVPTSEPLTYKELCRDTYSITCVTHKDGKTQKNPRGYSPDWFIGPILEKRAETMIQSKMEELPKFYNFKANDGLVRPRPIKKSARF